MMHRFYFYVHENVSINVGKKRFCSQYDLNNQPIRLFVNLDKYAKWYQVEGAVG